MRRTIRRGLVVVFGLPLVMGAGLWLLALPDPPSLAAPPRAPSLAIVDVARVDPDSAGHVVPHQTVLAADGVITAVGPADSIVVPAGSTVLDGRGRYLMPGLIDAHMHSLRLSPQLHYPLLVAHGVTAVRDLGDACSWSEDLACRSDVPRWRSAIAEGRIVGPRIVQHVSFHLESPLDDATLDARLDSIRARGEPVLKLQLDEASTPDSTVRRVMARAAARQVRVAGHLPFTVSLPTLRPAWVSVEHDWTLLPQCSRARAGFDGRNRSKAALLAAMDSTLCNAVLDAMRAAGTAYTPTHVASSGQDVLFAAGRASLMAELTDALVVGPQRALWALLRRAARESAEEQRVLATYHDAALHLSRRAADRGVVLLAGSDALDPDVVHGAGLHEELQYLVRATLTPAQALRAATSAPAEHFGVGDVVGRIAVGQRADLLLLTANPLDDIRNTQRIHTVVADGRVYDAAARDRLLTYVREQAHSWRTTARFLLGAVVDWAGV